MNAVLIHPSVPTADARTLLAPITVSVIRVSQEMGKLAAVRSFFLDESFIIIIILVVVVVIIIIDQNYHNQSSYHYHHHHQRNHD